MELQGKANSVPSSQVAGMPHFFLLKASNDAARSNEHRLDVCSLYGHLQHINNKKLEG